MPQDPVQASVLSLSVLKRRRLTVPLAALLLCFFVIGVGWACGGATESPDPTSTPAPSGTITSHDAAPEPTLPASDYDAGEGSAYEPDPGDPATPTAAAPVPGSTGRDWNILGSPDATVTVLDYSDFQ